MPLIQKKNEAHERMLQNHSTKNRKEFHRQRRVVKEAVQAAKERRVLQVARGGEKGGKDGHGGVPASGSYRWPMTEEDQPDLVLC